MTQPKPFTVDWSETDVRRVLDQVRHYPWPPAPAAGWLTFAPIARRLLRRQPCNGFVK